MKKGDFLWLLVLALVVAFLAFPKTNNIFVTLTTTCPFMMGFTKFFILATMGELLAIRIVLGDYKEPKGLIWRAIVWGFLGYCFVVIFPLFRGGVIFCAKQGFLPKVIWMTTDKLLPPELMFWGKLATALITSALINIAFAPGFMAFHRITDTYIDMMDGKITNLPNVALKDVIQKIDWNGFVSFVVLKTIPFFWIPAHTITFSLPPAYQIMMAAMLGIALGCILAFAKRRNQPAK